MNWLEAIILGIIQGLTEFLPISSSGHLVLAQYFMDIHENGVILEVIMHLGTLGAILVYYWDDLQKLASDVFTGVIEARKYIYYLTVATVPTVCVGLLLDEYIESTFVPSVVIVMFFITGAVLATSYFSINRPIREISLLSAFCIGMAQTCALMPGISRSGITISVALILGIKHREAAKFSFLMAIPTLFGVGLLQMIKLDNLEQIALLPLILGFFSSAVVGYLVIDWLLAVISKGKYYLFSLYCFTIAIITYILIN